MSPHPPEVSQAKEISLSPIEQGGVEIDQVPIRPKKPAPLKPKAKPKPRGRSFEQILADPLGR